jgi:cytochrome c556
MSKEESTYNWSDFKNAAETIENKAGSALLRHFLGNSVAAGSSANADIAIDRENFDALAKELAVYANALALSADRHPGRMSPSMPFI